MSETFVNGPINTFRLEGKIEGIKKVIYIFMDHHVDVMNQTKCGNIKSLDFHEYLVKTFDELSGKQRTVDFFMEIVPTDIISYPSIYKNRYIEEVKEVFVEAFNYNPEENVVGKSKIFPNVRLHYIDIRHLYYDNIGEMFIILLNINKSVLNNMEQISGMFNSIVDKVNSFQKKLEDSTNDDSTIKNIQKIPTIPNKEASYTNEEIEGKMSELINKIKNRYKHPKIKNVIAQLIQNEIINHLNLFNSKTTNLHNLINASKIHLSNAPLHIFDKTSSDIDYGLPAKICRSIDNDFFNLITDCNNHLRNAYTMFTDLFFLRRFLDKDEVTNGIVYTGGYHSANYIYVLVKHFDFKITNYSTLMQKYTLDKLHELIKNADHSNDIKKYIFPENRIQCSDLSNFPKHFE